MAKGKNDGKCKVLINLPVRLRTKFKAWCHENDMSMNSGICAFMETVTSKKKYKLQKRVLELNSK